MAWEKYSVGIQAVREALLVPMSSRCREPPYSALFLETAKAKHRLSSQAIRGKRVMMTNNEYLTGSSAIQRIVGTSQSIDAIRALNASDGVDLDRGT